MSVVVVGLEHPSTPLDLLERVAISEESLTKVLGALGDRPNLSEVVVVSTCLRTELYAVVERFHEGVADLQEFLATTAGISEDVLAAHVNVLFDDDVTVHLFEVAAGLCSSVLGETEVLGQVRRAAERAEAEKAAGPVLSGLFRRAVRAGRRVRSDTSIARGSTSLSHVAVDLAEEHLGPTLEERRVVVVGAGEMAEGVVSALAKRGVRQVAVGNRSSARAEQLAAVTGGRAFALGSLVHEIGDAQLVFVATGGFEHVIDPELLVQDSRQSPSPRSGDLLIVDMGMPRNVDPAVASVENVTLLDIEAVNARAENALARRAEVLTEARFIVLEEVERYRADERARGAAPVVSALRQRFEALLQGELERHKSRLSDLDERQLEEVESVLRDVMAKVAHSPTAALKEAAGTPRGERLVEALRALFDL
jgi:glutamyl-tRNA reductase